MEMSKGVSLLRTAQSLLTGRTIQEVQWNLNGLKSKQIGFKLENVDVLKVIDSCHMFHWRSSHYTVTHVRNKNSNIQGNSPNLVKVIFLQGTGPKGKNSLPLGAIGSIFSLKRSSHFEKGRKLKRIADRFSSRPFDVRNFFSVLVTPLCSA